MVRVHVRFHTERQAESFVANTELRALGPENRREVVRSRDAISRLFDGVIAAGIADGSFRTDAPHEANLAILNMCTAVAGWYRAEGPKTPDELAEEYVRFVLSLLGV
ncbi:MAG: hypothetical protein ACMVY4_01585 [Minwuia sp.]|uniref:hypothetical protein n=1 Tax=Minwuia sp. TaxID=2493630 RepID=UPI003A8A2D59